MNRIVPIVPIIESQEQQQQVINIDYEKKQVKTMEEHADRNKDVGDVMYEKAQTREAEGNETGSRRAYSEAGHNYMKAAEKYGKAALVANNKEDATFDVTYTQKGKEKTAKKKVIKEHSIELVNENLGSNALTSTEKAQKIDKITGNEKSYITLQYGDKNNDVVSLDKYQATFLKETTEEIKSKLDELKQEEKKKQEKKEFGKKISEQMVTILGYED